jgi:predicted ABC-type ATPase
MPSLYLIGGHNGAGKSTYGRLLLPEIAHSLSVFDGDAVYHATLKEAFVRLKVAKLAQREAMQTTVDAFEGLVETALADKQDFAYEGHFNGDGPWETVQRFKDAGYVVHMVFLGLSDLALSVGRVEKRVEQGGHYVSPYNVQVNYEGNLRYLNARFRMLDSLTVFDTSAPQPKLLANLSLGKLEYQAPELPRWFREGLPNVALLTEDQTPKQQTGRRPD